MRFSVVLRLSVLTAFFMGAPVALAAQVTTQRPPVQTAQNEEQLHEQLEAVQRNSSLIAANASAFHLAARIDLFDASKSATLPASTVDIDELWYSPTSWKLSIKDESGSYSVVVAGSMAFKVGKIEELSACCHYPGDTTVSDVVQHAIAALLAPIREDLLHGVTRVGVGGACWDKTIGDKWPTLATCMGVLASPHLVGSQQNVPVVQTEYRFLPKDLTLRHISTTVGNPQGYQFDLYDYASFGLMNVPRTIDVARWSQGSLARMHVLVLEPASALSPSLSIAMPPGAVRITPYSQDRYLVDELVPGAPLSASPSTTLLKHLNGCGFCVFSIQIDVDTLGHVSKVTVPTYAQFQVTPEFLDQAKHMQFRLGYRNDHAAPFSYWPSFWPVGSP